MPQGTQDAAAIDSRPEEAKQSTEELVPTEVPAPPDAVDLIAAKADEAARLARQDAEIRERSARLGEIETEVAGQRQRVAALLATFGTQAAGLDRLEAIAQKATDIRARRESFSVADVSKGTEDIEGRRVEEVYARKGAPKGYAVYKVKDGDVWVQMSDDAEGANVQRTALGKVSILRWDIDRLADDWKREAHYHRELAAGLQLALQGNEQEAQDKLTRVLDALRQERAIAGRVQYMVYAALTALALLCVLYVFSESVYPFTTPSTNVWLAGKGGLMGAFLSIAISIRGRTVALDNDSMSNALEGAVRLSIGVIAGGFLLLALGSGFLTRVVAGDITGVASGGQIANWQAAVILGFLGGFVERLVPNLLDKAQPQTAAQGASQGGPPGQQKAT